MPKKFGKNWLRLRRAHESLHYTEELPQPDAIVDCGWGRLLFANTFDDVETLVSAIRAEGPEQRDIAMYVMDPHVLLASAPAELFLDPSHTYRLNLSTYRGWDRKPSGFFVRRMVADTDADAVNRIYSLHNMVQVRPSFFEQGGENRALTYFVAEDEETGAVIGTVTGVDHQVGFEDPQRGSSLWCLAVDPQTVMGRHWGGVVSMKACAFPKSPPSPNPRPSPTFTANGFCSSSHPTGMEAVSIA